MTDNQQTAAFDKDVQALIYRYRSEFQLSYAVAIGVLNVNIGRLMKEALDSEEEDDE